MPLKPSSVAGPLNGVVILDLTRVLAGPFCTMVLADMGARVIKIELPGTGDDARQYGPFVNGKSTYFMSLNRGKESLALDLKAADDRAIFDDLLAHVDVLIENFRAGTLARLGYGWEHLHQAYPTLIYAAVSGFGHTGPYAERAAYDVVVQGMGGLMSMTGYPGQPPVRVGAAVGDITAGLFMASGLNAALYHRAQTGEGRKLDVSMLDCQVAICENAIARYLATGRVPVPQGARHPSIAPFEAYATGEGYITVAAGNDTLFATLAETLARPELVADQRFSTNEARIEHVEELKCEIEAILADHGAAHWLELLRGAGIPCGPINDIKQVIEDPQINARNMVVDTHDDIAGPIRMAGNPVKISSFPDPSTRRPSPDLDADRAAILAELAGTSR